jgi:hypothetical protein
MNLFLTQEERLAAVLDNVLSPDILTDDDMDLLFSRLCEAIQQKSEQGFSGSSGQRH